MSGDWRNKLQEIGGKIKNSGENKIANLGYAFQAQDYYETETKVSDNKKTETKISDNNITETKISDNIKNIINFKINCNLKEKIKKRKNDLENLIKRSGLDIKNNSFKVRINYPGLVVGMSNPIMCGIVVDDEKGKIKKNVAFDTGFNFDYVTGLPYIPGSTIKGMLRASIIKYQNDVLEWLKENSNIIEVSLDELVNQIFGDENNNEGENVNTKMKGNYTNVSDRDIFLDAIIIACEENILKSDYITPHPSMFENPKPIHILALKPDVQLQFHFLLSPRKIAGIDSEKRFELYKSLILDLGIGAKTNTGYGNLTEI